MQIRGITFDPYPDDQARTLFDKTFDTDLQDRSLAQHGKWKTSHFRLAFTLPTYPKWCVFSIAMFDCQRLFIEIDIWI